MLVVWFHVSVNAERSRNCHNCYEIQKLSKTINQMQLIVSISSLLNLFGIYNNFKCPVIWSISRADAGPMARTVFEFGAICVRPASLMRQVLRFFSRAALNTVIISSSLSTFTAIFALPESSQRRIRFGNRFIQFWYAPTAACPHCAPIFPLPIFKSFRTTRIIFRSLLSE